MALLWAARLLVARSVPPLSLLAGAAQSTHHIVCQAATLRTAANGSSIQASFRGLASASSGTGTSSCRLGRAGAGGNGAAATRGLSSRGSIPSVERPGGSWGAAGAGSSTGETSSGLSPLPGGSSAETSSGLRSPPGAGPEIGAGLGSIPVRGAESTTGLQSPSDAAAAEASTGLRGATPAADGTAGSTKSAESPDEEQLPSDDKDGADTSGGGGAGNGGGGGGTGEGAEAAVHDKNADGGSGVQDAGTLAGAEGAVGAEGAATGGADEPGPEALVISERADTFLTTLCVPLRLLTGYFSVQYLQNFVELDFNEADFLESAKDAYYMVQQLFMDCDLEGLRPMASPAIMAAFEDTVHIMAEERTSFKVLEHQVDGAFISNVQFLSPAEYEIATKKSSTADEKRAARESAVESRRREGMDSQYAANKYMVITVHFSGVMKSERVAVGNAGSTKQILTDRQTNVWKFANGPLPDRLPIAHELDGDWTVIGIA